MTEATIILILKPGKDPLLPDSYRPISLLTTDVKLLARVLVTLLALVIQKLIHRDQSGFIPSRSTALNIRRLFLNMQIPVDKPSNRAVLSLNAAKAFDSIKWPYLWEVLERFDLGETFIKWLQLLYTNPTARLRVNGDLSEPFRLFRGMRQGCPLSPLLFALALELLAETVRASPLIEGFVRGSATDKISLYADDTLLYMGDTSTSLSNVMSIITQFGTFSSFSINWSKLALLPLDELTSPLPECAGSLQVVTSFKYLGVQVI